MKPNKHDALPRILLPVLACTALIAAQPAAAADASPRENLGVAAGALIGALAGGPVGLVVGAALGGHHGASAHEAARVPMLVGDLEAARTTIRQRDVQTDRLEAEIARRGEQLTALNAELDQADVERDALLALRLDLLYTTDSAELTASGRRQVEALAGLLNQMPDLDIRLDGYADPRGTDAHNAALSEARASAVRDLLISAGIDPARIGQDAHGESTATADDGDLDAYALERRVSITLSRDPAKPEPAVVDNR